MCRIHSSSMLRSI